MGHILRHFRDYQPNKKIPRATFHKCQADLNTLFYPCTHYSGVCVANCLLISAH